MFELLRRQKLDLLGAYYADNVNDGMRGNVRPRSLSYAITPHAYLHQADSVKACQPQVDDTGNACVLLSVSLTMLCSCQLHHRLRHATEWGHKTTGTLATAGTAKQRISCRLLSAPRHSGFKTLVV